MRLSVITAGLVALSSSAHADVTKVYTDLGETRACLPLASGGALVGTAGGLVRVADGGKIASVWTATDGLPGTRIEQLAAIGDALWVGTDAGAARITVDTKLTVHQTVGTRGVRDVVSFDGATYVATWGGGLQKVTTRGTSDIPFRAASKQGQRGQLVAIAIAGNTLYTANATGLYKLAGGKLEAVALSTLPQTARIASLHGDGDTLWIATSDGLWSRTGTAIIGYGGGDLRRVTKLGDSIVVAGLGDGLSRVDRGRLARLPDAPRGLALAQTIASRGGATCAGGLDGAWLQARAGGTWIRAAQPTGLPSNDISAVAVDGDRLWVGTFDRGLAVLERGSWRAVSHANLDARINALLVERRGPSSRLWIATAAGLHAIDGTDLAKVTRLGRADGLPSRGVMSLAAMRDGRILVGTSAGAAILGDNLRATRVGPKDIGNVWAVAEDARGGLWLGTTTGLYRGTATPDAPWQRFALATGELRDDWVMALAVRGDQVFAGTYKGGVTRFDVASTIKATQLGAGWINPNGLSFDGDRLLAATMDGLLAGDGNTATWTAAQPGLPGRDVTAAARTPHGLAVATRRGLAELR